MSFDKNRYYDYQNGIAIYVIKYKNMEFTGMANCHPDDLDMESERVGLTIAEQRAEIKLACFIRDFEIKPQLKALSHLQNNIKMSKNYNPKSYETKMLHSQLQAIKKELDAINNEIVDGKKFLKDYINGKEKLYQKLRVKKQ